MQTLFKEEDIGSKILSKCPLFVGGTRSSYSCVLYATSQIEIPQGCSVVENEYSFPVNVLRTRGTAVQCLCCPVYVNICANIYPSITAEQHTSKRIGNRIYREDAVQLYMCTGITHKTACLFFNRFVNTQAQKQTSRRVDHRSPFTMHAGKNCHSPHRVRLACVVLS